MEILIQQETKDQNRKKEEKLSRIKEYELKIRQVNKILIELNKENVDLIVKNKTWQDQQLFLKKEFLDKKEYYRTNLQAYQERLCEIEE